VNRERERERYCLLVNCRDYRRCKVKWGKDCTRQMGSKIPRLAGWPHEDRREHWGTGHLVITGGPGEEIRVRRVSGDPYYG